jgi:hypothetical protein
MHTDLNRPELRELDQRSADGLEVTLLWSERTGSVFVCVEDKTASKGFHFTVDPTDALEAFRHPYGYRRREPASAGTAIPTRRPPWERQVQSREPRSA